MERLVRSHSAVMGRLAELSVQREAQREALGSRTGAKLEQVRNPKHSS